MPAWILELLQEILEGREIKQLGELLCCRNFPGTKFVIMMVK